MSKKASVMISTSSQPITETNQARISPLLLIRRLIARKTNPNVRPCLLRRQSSLLLTHIQSSLPTTPTAWALLSLAVSSAVLQHELRLQRLLSVPPDVFCDLLHNKRMSRIYKKLSREGGIFSQSVVPSLFVGTRGVVSSMAAYALKAGGTRDDTKTKVSRIREVMTMGADGAKILLDWEIPNTASSEFQSSHCGEINKISSIAQPVVLLVHGMNNDSSFGYIRSMMKTATSRGWVAVCMNLRGQDGMGEVKNTTPRGVSSQHHERGFQNAMKKAMLSRTIGQLDDACAPYILRNEPNPPYAPRLGYKNGKEYWHDSSSHRYVGHVSVPLLKVAAKDDFLVFGQFSRKLNHCLENPNVVVVKTQCDGHLGWQESPPPSRDTDGKASAWFGGGIGSWSDVAVADFIEALLETRNEDRSREEIRNNGRNEAVSPKLVSKL
eukprot:CCRYP_000251-RA/>CCRYP_000251-RA protein AED:0.15 eAED:0.11 QI:0/0/0/1/0.5/0.33/3/0/437